MIRKVTSRKSKLIIDNEKQEPSQSVSV